MAEIVLAVGHAVVGRLAEPAGRGLVVGLAVDAFGVEHGEIVHRLGVAGFGGGDIEAAGGVEVLLHADALFVEAAEAELRRRQALVGGALEPRRGLGQVLRDAAAFGEARSRPRIRRPRRPSRRRRAGRCRCRRAAGRRGVLRAAGGVARLKAVAGVAACRRGCRIEPVVSRSALAPAGVRRRHADAEPRRSAKSQCRAAARSIAVRRPVP